MRQRFVGRDDLHISVALPAFNAGSVLSRALGSIQVQTRPVDEVVLVDDGSSDNTEELVKKWSELLPIIYLKNHKNIGIARSLRRALDQARGDLVLRIDADDEWLPSHVEKCSAMFCMDPDISLIASRAINVDENGNQLGLSKKISERRIRADLMWDNPIVHSGVAISRRKYEACGGYSTEARWQDYDLWIRMLETGRLGFIEEPSVRYLVSPHSLSREPRHLAIRDRWRCAQTAIDKFYVRHPLSAIYCYIVGSLRGAAATYGVAP